MKYKYLTIHAEFRSTGVFDKELGEIEIEDLKMSAKFNRDFNNWIKSYETYNLYRDDLKIDDKMRKIYTLDCKGFELCNELKKKLGNRLKVHYYSDALQEKVYLLGGNEMNELFKRHGVKTSKREEDSRQ